MIPTIWKSSSVINNSYQRIASPLLLCILAACAASQMNETASTLDKPAKVPHEALPPLLPEPRPPSLLPDLPLPPTHNITQLASTLNQELPCLSCRGRCGVPTNDKPFFMWMKEGCQCLPDCDIYGDCCPDFLLECGHLVDANGITTKELMTHDVPYYCYWGARCWDEAQYPLINTCIYNDHVCSITKQNVKTGIPVVDTDTGLHYTNLLCAMCNGAKRAIPWKIEYLESNFELNATSKEFQERRRNSTPIADDEHWEVWKLSLSEIARFHPPAGWRPQRRCHGPIEVIDGCPPWWPNDEIRKACDGGPRNYVYHRFPAPGSNFDLNISVNYYNYFCALCHHVSVSQLSCGIRLEAAVCGGVETFSLEKLFVLDPATGISSNAICKAGETYVEEERKCMAVNLLIPDSARPYFEMSLKINLNDFDILPFERAGIIVFAVESSYKHQIQFYLRNNRRDWRNSADLIQLGGRLLDNATSTSGDFVHLARNVSEDVTAFLNRSVIISSLMISSLDASCKYEAHTLTKYTYFDSSGRLVLQDNRNVPAGQYYVDNRTVYACLPVKLRTGDDWMFSDVIGILTIICMVLSILCLVTHLILKTKLKTRESHLMVGLTICLIIAHSCFLLAPLMTEVYPACYTVGVLLHLSFLASFCWMCATAADIFFLVDRSSHLQQVDPKKRPMWLLVLPFLPACVIVLVSIAFDWSQLHAIWRPHYGSGQCWINTWLPLLAFFVAPVAVLVLLTAVLTVVSAVRIGLMRFNPPSSTVQRLGMFIKLSILTGFGWLFGFIAIPTRNTVLFALFVILNASQGVFIFLVTWIPYFRKRSKSDIHMSQRSTSDTSTGPPTTVSNSSAL